MAICGIAAAPGEGVWRRADSCQLTRSFDRVQRQLDVPAGRRAQLLHIHHDQARRVAAHLQTGVQAGMSTRCNNSWTCQVRSITKYAYSVAAWCDVPKRSVDLSHTKLFVTTASSFKLQYSHIVHTRCTRCILQSILSVMDVSTH